jgi:hypothetical protein
MSNEYALIVGLSEYPAVGNLKGPVNDLHDVYGWLTGDLHVPEDHIKKWSDAPMKLYREPTAEDFINWLLDCDASAKDAKAKDSEAPFPLGDRLYVYYAGHGYNATTAQQSMIMPVSTRRTWNVVPVIPFRESIRLRGYFKEIVMVFDGCRDVLTYAKDLNWPDQPDAAASSGNVKVFSAFASKSGKKALEKQFADGRWCGVLTQAFLAGAKGYAADETGVVYAAALKKFVFAAVKDRLGVDHDPDVDDGSDPNDPLSFPLFNAPRKLPRILIKPVNPVNGKAALRRIATGDVVQIDLSAGPQTLEVPYGYYGLTLPGQPEQKIIAAWEEKIVEA